MLIIRVQSIRMNIDCVRARLWYVRSCPLRVQSCHLLSLHEKRHAWVAKGSNIGCWNNRCFKNLPQQYGSIIFLYTTAALGGCGALGRALVWQNMTIARSPSLEISAFNWRRLIQFRTCPYLVSQLVRMPPRPHVLGAYARVPHVGPQSTRSRGICTGRAYAPWSTALGAYTRVVCIPLWHNLIWTNFDICIALCTSVTFSFTRGALYVPGLSRGCRIWVDMSRYE